MFQAKQKVLIESKPQSTSVQTKQPFLDASYKKQAITRSENGAIKYSTTGNDFVDQFGQLGSFKVPRSYNDIAKDMVKLWGQNPGLTIALLFFMRMVTRVTQLFSGIKTKSVQRGAGLKHEGIVRMIWLHVNHQDTFWKNIHLFISVGSWKDIIQMLQYDLIYNGWNNRALNWDAFGNLILAGLENEKTSNLVKKYLPQIKANSKCKTLEAQADNIIAKWICSLIFGLKGQDKDNYNIKYKYYRQLKVSGTAHQWQQLISKKLLDKIDFNTVHGRALSQLVSGKFLANNKLEAKYEAWIASKPVAKFTGYVPELFLKLPTKKYQIHTFNAQFRGLVETAKKGAKQSTRFITVVDTSNSMDSQAAGIKLPNMIVAQSLALFFTNMLDKGPFTKSWYNFSDRAVVEQVHGNTPWEQYSSIQGRRLCCHTNFQSVINHFCWIRSENPQLTEEDFPNGFLVLSDGEMNNIGTQTNTTALFNKLKAHFSPEFVANFKLVYWNLANSHGGGKKFETYGEQKNIFYFSGYDGSTIAFLTGLEGKTEEEKTPQTAEELMKAALSQEILSYIEL